MAHIAYPPETVEGWYALHQLFALPPDFSGRAAERESAIAALCELSQPSEQGWTAAAGVIGSRADIMLMHFRPTLDDIGVAERRLRHEPLFGRSTLVWSFLSVTEAGLYHITAALAREAKTRGGQVGDDAFRAALAERVQAETNTPHVQRRLYPRPPADMPYVCFYPMNKRRAPGENWYTLTLEERSQLMFGHSTIGRRYAGRVLQIITGAIGFDAWEWGVTLFARDPLEFKKLVTDMRFDEVSARYAEFGDFYVGRIAGPQQLLGDGR